MKYVHEKVWGRLEVKSVKSWTGNDIWDDIRNQILYEVERQVYDNIEYQIRDQIWDKIGLSIWREVWNKKSL